MGEGRSKDKHVEAVWRMGIKLTGRVVAIC